MESEILQELQLIRIFLFIIMCGLILVFIVNFIGSIQRVVIGFRDAFVKNFENRIEKLLIKGMYDEVVDECKEVLEKNPNDLDVMWYLARAYYMDGKYNESKEYFEKAVNLMPGWKKSAQPYLDKMNE